MLLHVAKCLDCCRSAFCPGARYVYSCLTGHQTALTAFWRVRHNAADAYRYGADTLQNSTVSSCHVSSCPIVTMQSTSNTTVWLQVTRWLASTIPNALCTVHVAEVDNEVDLEEDDASGVSS